MYQQKRTHGETDRCPTRGGVCTRKPSQRVLLDYWMQLEELDMTAARVTSRKRPLDYVRTEQPCNPCKEAS